MALYLVPSNIFVFVRINTVFSQGASANCFLTGLQTQSDKNRLYNGPFDAMKKIYSAHGIRGIYKGQGVTLLREATGYGVYFLAYEKLVQREMATKGIRREEISPAHAVLYGAAAGYAVCSRKTFLLRSVTHYLLLLFLFLQLWAVIYPIDMIKSRIQTDGFSPWTGQKYKSARDCFRVTLKTEGVAAFMRGLGPTLIR